MKNNTLADFRKELNEKVEQFKALEYMPAATERDYARLRLEIHALTDAIDNIMAQAVAR